MTHIRTEISKIHNLFSANTSWRNFSSDFEIHKKLLLAFQPGPAYFWILNARDGVFEVMSPEVSQVLGYTAGQATFPFLLEQIHKDDMPHVLNFEATLAEFFGQMESEKRGLYKIQYDFRLRHADGHFVRILNQMVMIAYDAETNLIKTFGVQTDISLLKTDNTPRLAFIGFDGEPSYFNVEPKTVFKAVPSLFSKREREILCLILDGKTSKEIADLLFISKYTVDTHRKKMLRKADCKGVSEMVAKAVIEGWAY